MQLKNKIKTLSNSSKYFSLLHTETMIAHFLKTREQLRGYFGQASTGSVFLKGIADFVGGKND